jgi:hypothetical protein
MFTLLVQQRGEPERELVLERATVVVGRLRENDLVLAAPNVSKRHATLVFEGDGELIVTDHGSTNGTFINDRRVDGSTLVGPQDRVQIGDFTIRLKPSRAGATAAFRSVPATPAATNSNPSSPQAPARPSTEELSDDDVIEELSEADLQRSPSDLMSNEAVVNAEPAAAPAPARIDLGLNSDEDIAHALEGLEELAPEHDGGDGHSGVSAAKPAAANAEELFAFSPASAPKPAPEPPELAADPFTSEPATPEQVAHATANVISSTVAANFAQEHTGPHYDEPTHSGPIPVAPPATSLRRAPAPLEALPAIDADGFAARLALPEATAFTLAADGRFDLDTGLGLTPTARFATPIEAQAAVTTVAEIAGASFTPAAASFVDAAGWTLTRYGTGDAAFTVGQRALGTGRASQFAGAVGPEVTRILEAASQGRLSILFAAQQPALLSAFAEFAAHWARFRFVEADTQGRLDGAARVVRIGKPAPAAADAGVLHFDPTDLDLNAFARALGPLLSVNPTAVVLGDLPPAHKLTARANVLWRRTMADFPLAVAVDASSPQAALQTLASALVASGATGSRRAAETLVSGFFDLVVHLAPGGDIEAPTVELFAPQLTESGAPQLAPVGRRIAGIWHKPHRRPAFEAELARRGVPLDPALLG